MRLFLGCPVPGRDAIQAFARQMKSVHPDLRLVPDGTYHVTLRFLGDVKSEEARERLIAAVTEALRGRAALPCTVAGLGAFPKANAARVAWIGVQAPGIGRLAESINSATALYGEPPDPRPFKAHVTVGRMKIGGDLSREAHEYKDTVFGTGAIDQVVLWSSVLGPGGPTYEAVASWPLTATGGPQQ